MPRNNWSQYLILPNGLGLSEAAPPAPPVVERIEEIAQVSRPEVVSGTTITVDDSTRRYWANAADPLSVGFDPYDLTQQRGPSEDSIRNWYVQGQHSRLPTCCIEFFCTRWARASQKTKNLYTRLLKKMHEDHKYLWQPGFIPCPKTVRAKDIVFMHHCDDHCKAAAIRASDIRRAKEQLERIYSGTLGRLENIAINESGPTIVRRGSDVPAPVQEMRNQREDNARLNGTTLQWRPRP